MIAAATFATTAGVLAQSPAREQLARGQALWDQRLAKSAIAALEVAARDPGTAAEAREALGRIFTFKGLQQESVFSGSHDDPTLRDRAVTELRSSFVADTHLTSALYAL